MRPLILLAALLVTGTARADEACDLQAGESAYIAGCSNCHGPAGEGGRKAPALIGLELELAPLMEAAQTTLWDSHRRVPELGDETALAAILCYLDALSD